MESLRKVVSRSPNEVCGGFTVGPRGGSYSLARRWVTLLQGTFGYAVPTELTWEEDPTGGHDEDAWARRFPRVMKALFGR